jgi:WD40 repeat protein
MTHEKVVTSVAFSPDGKYVVSGSGDRTARVWEALTGKEVARMTHEKVVNTVSFSPDGKYVVSGSGDRTTRVWEASTGREVARMTHDRVATLLPSSPDGKYVVTGAMITRLCLESNRPRNSLQDLRGCGDRRLAR